MSNEVILLTSEADADELAPMLVAADPKVRVRVAATLPSLEAALAEGGANKRLIAFCTDIIVPAATLAALPGPSYNFHPGPPEYPGLYPSVWAIYEGATTFGATCHEMADRVDAGSIVGVARAEIPTDIDRVRLDMLARDLVNALFERLAPALIDVATPIPPVDAIWGERTYTKKDFDSLLRLAPDVPEEEFRLRLRAAGEGPEHALTVELHGRLFKLAPRPGDDLAIFRGGRLVQE